MNTLQKFDQRLQQVIEVLLGISMILLTSIVFINAMARYVLKISLGALAELPQYLMIASVWFAASVLTAKKKHISLDVSTLVIKNKKTLLAIKIIMDILTLFYLFGCKMIALIFGHALFLVA